MVLVLGAGLDYSELNAEIGTGKTSRYGAKPVKYDYLGDPLPDDYLYWRGTLSPSETAAYDLVVEHTLGLEPYIPLPEYITVDKVLNVLDAVRFDHPNLFWLSNTINYFYTGGDVTGLELIFTIDKKEVPPYLAAFNKAAGTAVSQAAELQTDVMKAKFIHDYMLNTIEYDTGIIGDQSAFSAVILGRSVCMGYAMAFNHYMQTLGIKSIIILGEIDGEAHAWNLTLLDGEYYNIDVTWDDPTGNPADNYNYGYFNVTDEQIGIDHIREPICLDFPKADSEKLSFANLGVEAGSDIAYTNVYSQEEWAAYLDAYFVSWQVADNIGFSPLTTGNFEGWSGLWELGAGL